MLRRGLVITKAIRGMRAPDGLFASFMLMGIRADRALRA